MGLAHQGPGVFFLFVAFVLLVLVSVSTPVAHWLYFLKTTGNANLRFGIWGYCMEGTNGVYNCTKKHLGYNADTAVDLLGTTGDISGSIIHGLTYALILHPVAAGITLFAIIISLTTNAILDICGSFIASFAFLVTLVAFILDSVLFIEARHRINKAAPASPAKLGNAYWMVLVAMICLLIASFTVCLGSVSARRAKRNRQSTNSASGQDMYQPNRHFWQRN